MDFDTKWPSLPSREFWSSDMVPISFVYVLLFIIAIAAFGIGVVASDNQYSHGWKMQLGRAWDMVHRYRLMSEGYSTEMLAATDPGNVVHTAAWLLTWAAAFRIRRSNRPIVCD